MRHVLLDVAGLALLFGCADHNGLPTDQSVGNPAHEPSFAGAEIIRSNIGLLTIDPVSVLLVMTGFAEGETLADLCAAPPPNPPLPNSPNSLVQIVLPPVEAFLLGAHGRDVPILVYQFEDDPCDGVGESLLASGTGQFHYTEQHPSNGAVIANITVRGTLDLVAGGQAQLVLVGGNFNQAPDGSIRTNKGTIKLTPI